MNNEMIKCGIINDCINDSLTYYSKIVKYSKKIIHNFSFMRKITDKQLDDLKIAYKEFSKHFFRRKTINCMKKFCNPNPDHYDQIKKMIDDMKSKIISRKNILKLIDQNKNYVKLMDTIYKILDHFCKNYKKFFS
jgi:hypothetical protein